MADGGAGPSATHLDDEWLPGAGEGSTDDEDFEPAAKRARGDLAATPPTAAAKSKGKAPAAKAKGKRKAVDVRAHAKRLPRAALEELIVRAVESGITAKDVCDAAEAPVADQVAVPRGDLAQEPGLVSTGPFAALDAELTCSILRLLPTSDRVALTTSACKGWRSLRKEPSLWRDVAVVSDKNRPKKSMNSATAVRLLHEKGEFVHNLRIMGYKASFDAAALKQLVTMVPNATNVIMDADKAGATVFKQLAKMQGITSLSIVKTATALKGEELARIVGSLPSLTYLDLREFGGCLADGFNSSFGSALASAQSTARAGGRSLISTMSVDGLMWHALLNLGEQFPELASLKVKNSYRGTLPRVATSGRVAQLARLRVLHIPHMGDVNLVKVLAASPILEELHLSQGTTFMDSYTNRSPVPPVGSSGLAPAATTLRTLKITKISLDGGDALAGFERLETLVLNQTGAETLAALSRMTCSPTTVEYTKTYLGVEADAAEPWPRPSRQMAMSPAILSITYGSQDVTSWLTEGSEVLSQVRKLSLIHCNVAPGSRVFRSDRPLPELVTLQVDSYTVDKLPVGWAGEVRAPKLRRVEIVGGFPKRQHVRTGKKSTWVDLPASANVDRLAAIAEAVTQHHPGVKVVETEAERSSNFSRYHEPELMSLQA